MDDNLPTEETLDYAERWLRDGLEVLRPAFSVLQTTVDMTNATSRLEQLRRQGVQATATHLLVQATARALRANPRLHQIVAGNRRQRPGRVDIGLSVTGETFVAPVMVIEGADQKTVEELVEETTRRAPEIRKADQAMLRDAQALGTTGTVCLSPARAASSPVRERDVSPEGCGNVSGVHCSARLGALIGIQHCGRAYRWSDAIAGGGG